MALIRREKCRKFRWVRTFRRKLIRNIYILLLLTIVYSLTNPETGWFYDAATQQSFYLFEEITIDGLVVEGDGSASDGECYDSGICDVVGAFRRGVCENSEYQYSQQLCELLSVWNTDEEFCVGWRYADSNGSTTVPLMGREGEMGYNGEYPNTFYYMHQGDTPYIKVYDSSNGSILELIPSSELPGWENMAVEVIEGTSTANNMSGCTDSYASNYNEEVNMDDGSCLPRILSVPDDFTTIQEAVEYSINGDTILVSAGTYLENINFNDKNIALIGEDRETTIIDGGGNGSVVIFNNLESSGSLLKSFTIQNGDVTGSPYCGGGIYILESSPTLKDLTIVDNYVASKGGGIYIGINSYINAANILITNNYSEGHGAGIFIAAGSNINLDKSTIASNMVGEGNTFGAGIYADGGGTATLVNSIVYYNRREGDYGGNYNLNGYTMEILNEYTVSYSDIEGEANWMPEGEGNIYIAPEVNDFETGDFSLQSTSPCIDAGNPESELDPDGTRADMGAYPIYENCIYLHEGANLISFYVLPDDKLVANVLSSLGDNATGIVGEGVAASFDGWEWSGSVTTIDETSGYWVIISEEDELCIFGYPVIRSEVEYNLHSGANLVSYPYGNSNEIESALTEDAQANLTGIIGEGVAASQTDGEWNGSLVAFGKNEGYWLMATADFDMHYNEPTGLSRLSFPALHTNYNQSTQQAFYFIESIENIEQGDIIHTYYNGINVGSRVWHGSLTDVPAMGDDGSKFTVGYCISGSIPTFKIEKENGSLITLTGDIPQWSNNQLFIVGNLAEFIELPAVYSLSTAYPNPFNPTTTLSFGIPVISNVILEVYDINGRLISNLIKSNMDAGYHTVQWNAGSNSSGVYFVKMVAGEFTNTQKLMLIK